MIVARSSARVLCTRDASTRDTQRARIPRRARPAPPARRACVALASRSRGGAGAIELSAGWQHLVNVICLTMLILRSRIRRTR